MAPRSDRIGAVTMEINALEREVLDRMKVAAGVATDANLARIALWSLGDHLEIEMPCGVFDLREWARTPNPRINQEQPVKRESRPHPKPKTPAANHPWREPLADLLPKKGA